MLIKFILIWKNTRKDFCKEGKPYIGILFYREEWVWEDLTYQTALIREIEAQGMNAVCVFSNGMPNEEMGMPSLKKVFGQFFSSNGFPVIDVLLNTLKFSLTSSGSMDIEFLKNGMFRYCRPTH